MGGQHGGCAEAALVTQCPARVDSRSSLRLQESCIQDVQPSQTQGSDGTSPGAPADSLIHCPGPCCVSCDQGTLFVLKKCSYGLMSADSTGLLHTPLPHTAGLAEGQGGPPQMFSH